MRKSSRLPNFQNLGILLRMLLVVNILIVISAILYSNQLSDFLPLLTQYSALVQPVLLATLLALYMLNPWLIKLNYWIGIVSIFLLALMITSLFFMFLNQFFLISQIPSIARASLLTIIVCGITLYYFFMQQRAYSPAIAEARLQALQARIRPHFLFNSINAVLSLVRTQPMRAETALEDMADLFRVLMSENRDLVPLSQELVLCRQYLALEKLRLEDRLKINWQIESMPIDAMIPPLILQPLLENAVYHGIEPMLEGGEILINIYSQRKELHIIISNPFTPNSTHHTGNKMALNNIKERLTLHFDLEAFLKTNIKNNRYEVHIRIPC